MKLKRLKRLNCMILDYRRNLRQIETAVVPFYYDQYKLEEMKAEIIKLARKKLIGYRISFFMREKQDIQYMLVKEIKPCEGKLADDNLYLFVIIGRGGIYKDKNGKYGHFDWVEDREYIVDAKLYNDFCFFKF